MVYEIHSPAPEYMIFFHLVSPYLCHKNADAGVIGIKLKLIYSRTKLCDSFVMVVEGLKLF